MTGERIARFTKASQPSDSTTVPGPTNVPTRRSTRIKLISQRPVYKSFKPLLKPNGQDALGLVNTFGDSENISIVFDPSKQDAHIEPYNVLASPDAGAVSIAMTKDTILERMQANVKAANKAVEQFSGKIGSKRGWERLAKQLVDIYEMYFNRRTALLKELEIVRAKELLKRAT